MEWMLDIQLGRRNLSSFQRIVVVEKKRAYYDWKGRGCLYRGMCC